MEKYDFIIVGAGPAGCAVAARLAKSASKPAVLLLEAGGDNADRKLRVDGDRYLIMRLPGMNWGYLSTPQKQLNDRVIGLDRGKGLGGSSCINFAFWFVGAQDDFDEIARLLDDEEWSWRKVRARLNELESYHDYGGKQYTKYLNLRGGDHGTDGPLHIGFPRKLERSTPDILDVMEESGIPLNPDVNSGNPLGMSLAPNTAYNGVRSTAADLLMGAPSNLSIRTHVLVEKILFEGKTAIGVQTDSGTYLASKEVIISAGSLDSPKLLMLSGIGPAEELKKYDIPVIQDAPRIGKGMKDHTGIFLNWRRADHTSDRPAYYRDAKVAAAAREQFERDGTGPLSEIALGMAAGFLKNDKAYQSAEFDDLDEEVQQHLLKPTVPLHEIVLNCINFADLMSPTTSVARQCMFLFLLNCQSEGELNLQSADVRDAPLVNPNWLSHPFDRRVAIEATRSMMYLTEGPAFAKDTIAVESVPKSKSDEDILDYWRANTTTVYHPTGTVRMGKPDQPHTPLDTDFRVRGIKNLRIVDMSVLPIIPNGATQAPAYMTGMIAGDKLVAEYGLDASS